MTASASPEAPGTAPRPRSRRPGPIRLALEWRAPAEASATLLLWPWLRRGAKGDGHPVLVLPGLGASDFSTALLRRYLSGQGFDAHAWRLGRNLGPREGVFEALQQRLQHLHQQSGRRVSLVGWSLGGVFARELAKRQPDAVRQLITLGSPMPGHNHASNARRFYEFAAGRRAYPQELMARLHEPVPAHIPSTSVYSWTDGIVHWRASLQPEGEQRQNIRVAASHCGMGANPWVLRLLAQQLSKPELQAGDL
ncbi:lipase family alpha/beta hydrolase [Aquabacterium sp.]|uniref:lipase family alpha/beta hydrolase n=1 Tax=Aquabacterium sp. TaxID=1872578 RepID=UPI003784E9DC